MTKKGQSIIQAKVSKMIFYFIIFFFYQNQSEESRTELQLFISLT